MHFGPLSHYDSFPEKESETLRSSSKGVCICLGIYLEHPCLNDQVSKFSPGEPRVASAETLAWGSFATSLSLCRTKRKK